MLAKIIRLREEGRLLPRYRYAFGVIRGNLVVADAKDPLGERVVRLARVLDQHTNAVLVIRPLYDVTLVKVTRDDMWLAGYERHHDEVLDITKDYAQTWLVSPIPKLDAD